MRKDEAGRACPSTLLEYRAVCARLGGPDCEAVAWLDRAIDVSGPGFVVASSDADMRAVLNPLLARRASS